MIYQLILRPLLFVFSPESIHRFTFFIFRVFPGLGCFWGFFVRRLVSRQDMKVKAFGLTFPHAVGLAAGMDKNATILPFLKKAGFAYVEIGTITPKPQPGNPKPRLFRLVKERALINRMGFNNVGIEGALRQLTRRPNGLIVGANIGKNTLTMNEEAWKDYLACFKALYDFADYFVINVSCPNIKDLSKLQDKDSLALILSRVLEERATRSVKKPVLLKVSPDLSVIQLGELCDVVRDQGIDGLVATNTSVLRSGLKTAPERLERIGPGGLSGAPLGSRSTEVIRFLSQRLGRDYPIIASGGVMTPADAIGKIAAGASLVQVYTGYVYRGPGFIREILQIIRR